MKTKHENQNKDTFLKHGGREVEYTNREEDPGKNSSTQFRYSHSVRILANAVVAVP